MGLIIPCRFDSGPRQLNVFNCYLLLLCDLPFEEQEIWIQTKGLFLSTKRNFGLLIFWIKQKSKCIMVLNGIESLWAMIFHLLEDIREWEQSFLMLIERQRESIILWHNLERLCKIYFDILYKNVCSCRTTRTSI